MKKPMILPWLAHNWKVSDARTEVLWNEACRYAESVSGETRGSRYWGLAKSRMIDLLDNEVLARYPQTEVPWVMIQLNVTRWARMARYWLLAARSRFTHA